MEAFARIVPGVALLMLFDPYLAGTAHYFLSLETPRPLDDNLATLTILGRGFASRSRRSRTAELAGQGFADVRRFAARRQALLSLATFGFRRRVSTAWPGNAGRHPHFRHSVIEAVII